MATKIVTKNSSTASAVPTASDLVQGELAVNVADKKLFTEDNSGAIIELADGVKLAGIEASADVTDTANVTAAGALMDSELTSEASVKALNQGVATTDSPTFAGATVTSTLNITPTSGFGNIEVGGVDGAFIDLKSPSSDDYDMRLITSGGSGGTIDVGAAGDLSLRSGGSERVTLLSSGNVGIGTASPTDKLEVNGNIKIDTGTADGGQLILSSAGYSDWNNDNNVGAWRLYNGATERMRIDSSGNVGIGTTSPSEELEIASSSPTIRLTDTDDSTYGSVSYNVGALLLGGDNTTIRCSTAGSERMRMDSVGNVIVGKTTSATGTQGFVVSPNGSIFSSISSGNTYHTYNTTNNLFTFYVGYTGGVINYQANNVNLSDEREKKNIEPLESKWDSVKSWSLKTFHYNHQADESIKNYGVIAQDVEQTNPEAIDFYQKDENTERKGVKEQQMMWMAIKALQEAQTRIETLEARIAALEE
jgi:hypothetical protein